MINLKNTPSKKLVIELKELIQIEKKHTLKILKYFMELERRKLYIELGYPSLHSYCIDVLGYSSSEAYLKINAMKLLKEFSFIEEKIDKGLLSLTNVGELQIQIRRSEKMSKKRVTNDQKLELLGKIEKQPTRKANSIIKNELKIEDKVSAADFKINQKALDKLKKLGDKLNIKDLNNLIELLVTEKEDKLIEEKKQKPAKPIFAQKKRYIPLNLRRKIFIRANYRCENVINGNRCENRQYLEVDHLKPFAINGEHSLENCRIACRNCNSLSAIKFFGMKKMEKYYN